jgi:hypothetical protein
MGANQTADFLIDPFVIKGEGGNAIKFYFESEENEQEYL